MLGPPQLWTTLTTNYLSLPASTSWQLWRSIVRSRWSRSVEWREQFLCLSRQHAVLSRTLVADYLGELWTLARLTQLVEGLVAERVLMRRDGTKIEEALFGCADATGQFHQRQKEGV